MNDSSAHSERSRKMPGRRPPETSTLTGLHTAAEIAAMLRLSPGTILDWWEAGRLPGYRLGARKSGPVRFKLDEIEAWLEGCRVEPRPEP